MEKSSYKGLDRLEQIQFPTMTKEEIIKKYVMLKLKLEEKDKDIQKARQETEFYLKLCEETLQQHELLKLKFPDLSRASYNNKWSWVNKIVFVLRKVDRPLTSPEIIELISPYEPGLRESYHQAQAFSPNLNKAVKYKRVIAYKLGGSKGYYYVLPEWIDSEGNLTKDYETKIYFIKP